MEEKDSERKNFFGTRIVRVILAIAVVFALLSIGAAIGTGLGVYHGGSRNYCRTAGFIGQENFRGRGRGMMRQIPGGIRPGSYSPAYTPANNQQVIPATPQQNSNATGTNSNATGTPGQ